MMTSSVFQDYLGGGAAAARPVAATLGPTIPTGMSAYYFATDTGVLSILAGGDTAWQTAGGGLSSIANDRILANISGASAAPSANTLSDIIDACIANSQGDILYRGASGWAALAHGTAGEVLQTNGAGADPSWVTAGGGGGGVPAGTSFPGSPGTGDQFFRTDRGLYYFYDGAHWLTTDVFSVLLDPTALIQMPLPYGGTYDLYLIGLDVSGNANSGTNSTNYPSYSLHAYNGGTAVDTNVSTITGIAWAANIWNHTTTVPNTVVASTYDILYITKSYVGGSSAVVSDRMVARFRLIG